MKKTHCQPDKLEMMLTRNIFTWPSCINFTHEYILTQGDENWQAIFVSEFFNRVPTHFRY